MAALVTYFDPQPRVDELPAVLPSPFAPGAPHPVARRAAEEVMRWLREAEAALAELDGAHGGKMFGVLVVLDRAGRVGYLRGFSGMLHGTWHVDGFVGPLFDPALRDATWPAGEAELRAFDDQLESCGRRSAEARAALAAFDAGRAAEAGDAAARLEENRRRRDEERRALAAGAPDERALRALAEESRRDTTVVREQRAAARLARAPLAAAVTRLEEERRALKQRQAARSCELLELLFEGYQIPNARGQRRSVRALFAPATPPGGSGDCAAPKLVAEALAAGLRPIALAEFWWGTPPSTGGRHAGVYYPACRGKCGPVLGHMLDGLAVEPAPLFGAGTIAAHEPVTVFEDDWLVIVEKPVGLLSVPGRGGGLRDCVLSRLRVRYPNASGPLVVHRLDLDTSGLLLAAKDARTHAALQAQFCRREVEKRYVAWLEGSVAGEEGTIDLALRVDVDDRPRQIHDPVHGHGAVTDWRVIERAGGRTRVALFPRTGRTHQLRVHAAHPLGLAAPIVGDRLYGQPGERLLLHAEALAFAHPHTGQTLQIRRPAPF